MLVRGKVLVMKKKLGKLFTNGYMRILLMAVMIAGGISAAYYGAQAGQDMEITTLHGKVNLNSQRIDSLEVTQDEIKREIKTIRVEQFRAANELTRLSVEQVHTKESVAEVKDDLKEVKIDLKEVKTDLKEVKTDLKEVRKLLERRVDQ